MNEQPGQPTAGLILAAGMSTRMRKQTKQLINVNGMLFTPGINQSVCLDQSLFDDLMALEGDRGDLNIILNNKHAVNLIEVDEDGCYFDIDTPQDLVQLRTHFQP